MALKNFEECIKPGGFLLIDHRNYDDILGGGAAPAQSIYYNVGTIFAVFIILLSLMNFVKQLISH